ncbi:Flp family type IVb pilin [Brevundimonas sp.]|uniref:Flp family type IVb pilin n=1 Tax=Brevundimonas sp. TaxID=1871086 RepID=UPI00356594DA
MLRRLLSRFGRDDSGATAIECGLILSLMVLVILVALYEFGGTTDGLFQITMNRLSDAMRG